MARRPTVPHARLNAHQHKTARLVGTGVISGGLSAPANLTPPSITGTAQVGQVLTRVNGTWSNSPTSFAHQWYAAGVAIAGATGATYTPVAGDLGKAITVSTVATNAAGSSALVTSAGTANVIADATPVSISGTLGAATVGALYAFTPTTANGSGTKSFSLSGSLPAGLSFSSATGRISGTPTASGTTGGISITVTDTSGSATLGALSIAVTAGPNWPALTTARTAANSNNPQTAALYPGGNPTVAYSSTDNVSTTFATQYPATTTAAGWQAATDIDGGKPIIVGGNLNVMGFSQSGASSSWSSGSNLRTVNPRVAFTFTGTDFALRVVDGVSGKPAFMRVLVNGQYTSRTPVQITPGTNAGVQFVTVTLPAAVTSAVVTLEFNGEIVINWLRRRAGDTMGKPGALKALTALFVTDSIGNGAINDPSTGITRASNAAPGANGDGLARRIADLLGVNAVLDCLGGTGWLAGTSGSTRFRDRLLTGGDLAALIPLVDMVVIMGGINDAIGINGASYTRATFQSAVATDLTDIVSAILTINPNIRIVVCGNFYNSSLVGAGATPTGVNPNTEADIFAGAAAAKAAYPAARVNTVNVVNLMTGTGSVAAPAGNGNADLYLNSDRTHPNTAGEAYLAPLLATRIYDAAQALAA